MEPKKLSQYTAIIESGINNLNLPEKKYPTLYCPITYALEKGGKRLRPVLVLMACEALGTDCSAALDAAIGVEMFHNFTLVHDDIMDRSPMRRGKPAVHARWDEATAILSGDAMVTLAAIYASKVDAGILPQVTHAFHATAMAVYEGQALDMEFENRTDVSIDEYIRMIGLKTGALIGGALEIGALIGGADAVTCRALYDFGYTIGLAFQICDDYLDVYGNEIEFGKPIGGDICNNKKTWLLLSALTHGSKELEMAMQMPAGKEKVACITDIFTNLGIHTLALREIEHYHTMALHALQRASLPECWEKTFSELAARLINRKK